MKNIFKKFSLIFLILSFLVGLASCDLLSKPEDPEDNDKIPDLSIDFSDKEGIITVVGADGLEILVEVDGKRYEVENGSYDLKELALRAGEYRVKVFVSLAGFAKSDSFYYSIDSESGKGEDSLELVFNDQNGERIKKIYFNPGEMVEPGLYPYTEDKVGATYRWDTDAGFAISEHTTVNLIAEYENYNINYNLDGGALKSDESDVGYITEYNVDSVVTLPTPKKSGYTFKGWYLDSAFSGNAVISFMGEDYVGGISVYAKWEKLSESMSELFEALDATLAVNKATVIYRDSESGNTEEHAFNLSEGYAHSKAQDEVQQVTLGDYTYYLQEYIYCESARISDLDELIGLEILYSADSVKDGGEKDGVKTLKVTCKDEYKGELIVKIKDGKVIYFAKDDNTYEFEISYTVSKVDIDTTFFKAIKDVEIWVRYISEKEGESEFYCHDTARFIEGEDIYQNEAILYLADGGRAVSGIYADEDCENAVSSFENLESRIYVELLNPEDVAYELCVTIRIHCECDECDGAYKDIKMSAREAERYCEEYWSDPSDISEDIKILMGLIGYYHIRDGYATTGPYINTEDSSLSELGKEYTRFNLMDLRYYVESALRNAGQSRNIVINTFMVREAADTVKATVHILDTAVEKYFVRYNSYEDTFIFDYLPEGYIYIATYPNPDFTDPGEDEEGKGGNEWRNMSSDVELYAKVVPDYRKEVTVHFGKDVSIKIYNKIDAQGMSLGKDIVKSSYTLKIFESNYVHTFFNNMSVWQSDGGKDGLLIGGYYLDAEFKQPIYNFDTFEGISEIYVKWGENVDYTLHFVDGYTESGNAISGAILADIVEDYIIAQHGTSDYISVKRFYSDPERTQEIFGVIPSDIYVGYTEIPKITFICPDGCAAEEHEVTVNGGSFELFIWGHYIEVATGVVQIDLYYDSAFTQPVGKDDYIDRSMTVYGKPQRELKEITVHCGCFNHGDTGFTTLAFTANGVRACMEQSCDFGTKDTPRLRLYSDEARTERVSGEINADAVYAEKLLTIYVFGDYGFLRDDGGMKVSSFNDFLSFNGSSVTDEGGCFAIYEDRELITPMLLPTDYELKGGEVFYVKAQPYGQSRVITYNAIGYDYEKSEYVSYGHIKQSYLKVNKEIFKDYYLKVKGAYLDSEKTRPISLDNSYYLNSDITVYLDVELAPTMTIFCKPYLADDIDWQEHIYYLVDDDNSFAHYIMYSGYESLLPDESIFQSDEYADYIYELTASEYGGVSISFSDKAKAGTYYLAFRPYSANSVKLTVENMWTDEYAYLIEWGNGLYDDRYLALRNLIYADKGITGKRLYQIINGYGKLQLPNGQLFDVVLNDEISDENGKLDEYVYSPIFEIYYDATYTSRVMPSDVISSDQSIYIRFYGDSFKTLTVNFDNGTTETYYHYPDSSFIMELVEYLYTENVGFDANVYPYYQKFPTLFKNGVPSATYLDREKAVALTYDWVKDANSMKNILNIFVETTGSMIKASFEVIPPVFYKDSFGHTDYTAWIYYGANPFTVNEKYSIYAENGGGFEARFNGFVGFKPYYATDPYGNNRITLDTKLESGTYYVLFERDSSMARVVINCGCDERHSGISFGKTDENGEHIYSGTALEFYVKKGADFTEAIEIIQNATHGDNGIWDPADTLEYFLDAAFTRPISQMTVNSDTVIYVRVTEG